MIFIICILFIYMMYCVSRFKEEKRKKKIPDFQFGLGSHCIYTETSFNTTFLWIDVDA